MRETRTHLRFALAILVLSALCASCKSDGYMPKRKKSRCNTCPTFSQVHQKTIDERTTVGLV